MLTKKTLNLILLISTIATLTVLQVKPMDQNWQNNVNNCNNWQNNNGQNGQNNSIEEENNYNADDLLNASFFSDNLQNQNMQNPNNTNQENNRMEIDSEEICKKEKIEKTKTISPEQELLEAIITRNLKSLKEIAEQHELLFHTKYNFANQANYTSQCGHITINKSFNGLSPLHIACIFGNLKIVKFLVEEIKVETSVKDTDNWLPIHYACLHDHLDIVQYLCQNCVYVNMHYTNLDLKFNSLANLQRRNSSQGCKCTNFCDENEQGVMSTSRENLIQIFAKEEIENYLYEFKTKILPEFIQRLYIAIAKGTFEEFKIIINSLYTYFPNLATLSKAFSRSNSVKENCKYYDFLAEDDDDVDYDVDKENPVALACICGNIDVIKYFVEEKRQNLNDYNKNRYDLLHMAKNREVFKYLIDKGKFNANESSENYYGVKPIHSAAFLGRLDILQYLVEELKINPRETVEDDNEETVSPISDAFDGRHTHIIKYLTSLPNYNIKLNEINEKATFDKKLFNDYKFLEYILGKIKQENNGELKLDYLKDKNGDTLVTALIKNPECIAKIICYNENIYLNGGMERLITNKTTENDSQDDITCLLLETLKCCNSLDKNNELRKNYINNLKNSILVIKMLKLWNPFYYADNQTETDNQNKKRKLNKKNVLKNTHQHAFIDDTLRYHIMDFAGYECFKDPKDSETIQKLRSPEFKERLKNKFFNNDLSIETFKDEQLIKEGSSVEKSSAEEVVEEDGQTDNQLNNNIN